MLCQSIIIRQPAEKSRSDKKARGERRKKGNTSALVGDACRPRLAGAHGWKLGAATVWMRSSFLSVTVERHGVPETLTWTGHLSVRVHADGERMGGCRALVPSSVFARHDTAAAALVCQCRMETGLTVRWCRRDGGVVRCGHVRVRTRRCWTGEIVCRELHESSWLLRGRVRMQEIAVLLSMVRC